VTETFPIFATCVGNQAYLASNSKGGAVPAGPDDTLDLLITVGRIYKILGEKFGMYIVVNNMGSTSLHPKGQFRRTDHVPG
jgi:hypothetical protein